MPRRAPVRVLIVSAAIAGAALLVSPAAAFHVPGGGYSGQVSGGGSIQFSVSGDGSAVMNLTLTGIHSGNCALSSRTYQAVPIANNSFDNGEVSGSFPNVRGAYGRLSILVSSVLSSCRITGTWSAITNADPSGSKECKSAQARVKKRKRALSRAKATGSRHKIRKARGRWEKARAVRDQFCG